MSSESPVGPLVVRPRECARSSSSSSFTLRSSSSSSFRSSTNFFNRTSEKQHKQCYELGFRTHFRLKYVDDKMIYANQLKYCFGSGLSYQQNYMRFNRGLGLGITNNYYLYHTTIDQIDILLCL